MDEDRLAAAGFIRDDEFAAKVREWSNPAEPWETWLVVMRFENPPETIPEILDRIHDVFFFPPDEIYFDDRLVPDKEWINANPAWAIGGRGPTPSDAAQRIAQRMVREVEDDGFASPIVAGAMRGLRPCELRLRLGDADLGGLHRRLDHQVHRHRSARRGPQLG